MPRNSEMDINTWQKCWRYKAIPENEDNSDKHGSLEICQDEELSVEGAQKGQVLHKPLVPCTVVKMRQSMNQDTKH